MKPQFLFLFLFVALLTTCHGIRAISPTRGYNIYIESGFSFEQRQLIVDAYKGWEKETEGRVSFVETYSPNYSQSVIIIKPSTEAELTKAYHESLVGRNNYRGSDNFMYIAVGLSRRDFYQTALHEFGHALGLDHDEDTSHRYQTVMTPVCSESSPSLTCLDMQAFCKVWKCNANFLPLCEVKIVPDQTL